MRVSIIATLCVLAGFINEASAQLEWTRIERFHGRALHESHARMTAAVALSDHFGGLGLHSSLAYVAVPAGVGALSVMTEDWRADIGLHRTSHVTLSFGRRVRFAVTSRLDQVRLAGFPWEHAASLGGSAAVAISDSLGAGVAFYDLRSNSASPLPVSAVAQVRWQASVVGTSVGLALRRDRRPDIFVASSVSAYALTVNSGFATDTQAPWIAIRVRRSRFSLEARSDFHPVLGVTKTVGLLWRG